MTIALRADNGKFVAAELDTPDVPLTATRDRIGGWERFEVLTTAGQPTTLVDGKAIALRAANGKYVCADVSQAGVPVLANRERIGPWETFRVRARSGGAWAFESSQGSFLCAELGTPDARLVANRSIAGPWERFEAVDPGSVIDPVPEPGPEPVPSERPVHPAHRADFLTMVLASGKAEHQNIDAAERYQHRDAAGRKAIRDAHVAAGMTRYFVDVCKDDADELAHPSRIVPYFDELQAVGLGVVILIAPEDAEDLQRKYNDDTVDRYCDDLKAALSVWKGHITEVSMGVEWRESFKRATSAIKVAKAIRSVMPKAPCAIHLNSGDTSLAGASWEDLSAAGVDIFDYQFEHPGVEDFGQGFLAELDKVKPQIRAAKAAVAGQVAVRGNEYAYFGKRPSSALIAHVSRIGRQIGDKVLEEDCPFSNGGPGYFPAESQQPVPPGTVDAISVNDVSFYTRTGADISSHLRAWPIQSKLSPRFSGGDVWYEHTASRWWPGDSVNANSWVGFTRDGRYRMYTNDHLRAGEPRKQWKGKLDTIDEPSTGWTARSGESLLLMVSRPARLGTFPTGKGRSQLVRVTAP